MNSEFTTILKKLVTEQGKEVLFNPAKCKAFLADYTLGEFKKESRLLIQTIEAGVPKAIDISDNFSQCKQQQIRVLHEEYFIAEDIADDIINTLGFILNKTGENTSNIASEQQVKLSSQNKHTPSCGTDKQIHPNTVTMEQQNINPSFKKNKTLSITILSILLVLIIMLLFIGSFLLCFSYDNRSFIEPITMIIVLGFLVLTVVKITKIRRNIND